jgi:hypothetical protein
MRYRVELTTTAVLTAYVDADGPDDAADLAGNIAMDYDLCYCCSQGDGYTVSLGEFDSNVEVERECDDDDDELDDDDEETEDY